LEESWSTSHWKVGLRDAISLMEDMKIYSDKWDTNEEINLLILELEEKLKEI